MNTFIVKTHTIISTGGELLVERIQAAGMGVELLDNSYRFFSDDKNLVAIIPMREVISILIEK